jgi:hypothetical protein
MTSHKLTSEQNRVAERTFTILGNIVEKATIVSAKWLVYLCAAAAIFQIVGPDIISNVAIPATGMALIMRFLDTPIIKRLIDKISGDLLSGVIDKVASQAEVSDEEILKVVEAAISSDEIENYLKNLFDEAGLLTEREFYRALARLTKRDQAQHQEIIDAVKLILDRLEKVIVNEPDTLQSNIDPQKNKELDKAKEVYDKVKKYVKKGILSTSGWNEFNLAMPEFASTVRWIRGNWDLDKAFSERFIWLLMELFPGKFPEAETLLEKILTEKEKELEANLSGIPFQLAGFHPTPEVDTTSALDWYDSLYTKTLNDDIPPIENDADGYKDQ